MATPSISRDASSVWGAAEIIKGKVYVGTSEDTVSVDTLVVRYSNCIKSFVLTCALSHNSRNSAAARVDVDVLTLI